MRLGRAARLSLRALLAHRLRSALALGSVAIGVAGVLLTSALGEGAQAEVRRGIESTGGNLLVVRPAPAKRSAARRPVKGLVTTLRLEDCRAIAGLAVVRDATPGLDGRLRVKAGAGSLPATVLGTGPAYARLRALVTRSGRFIEDEDDGSLRRVAVLGDRVARTLFRDLDPVGADVRVRGVPFEVVGVLAPKGIDADGSDLDGNVFVPLRTALRRVFNTTWLTTVSVSVPESARMREAEAAIRDVLRQRHGLADGVADDFAIQDQARLLATQRRAVESLAALAAGLAGVSLLVGGAGILALMLLSVKERTGEIGLRMAVGARPRDVLVQFVAEATLLALGGWAVGAALAALGSTAVAFGTRWPVGLPAGAGAATLLMALVIGLGFGAVPARKAALLPPVEALAASP